MYNYPTGVNILSRSKKNFISEMGMKKGALHKEMGIPENKKIPAERLEKAAHSGNKLLSKRVNLAKTLKSFHSK